jgi:hypothetical protein
MKQHKCVPGHTRKKGEQAQLARLKGAGPAVCENSGVVHRHVELHCQYFHQVVRMNATMWGAR